jgi:hypothetical protein
VDRTALSAPIELADAGVPDDDAALDPDAYAPPGVDAFVEVPDAFLAAPDAFVPSPDAFAPMPDAFVPPPDAFVPRTDASVVCSPTAETCNGRDDDCNGLVDDRACGARVIGGAFVTCEAYSRGTSAYLVCGFVTDWDDARATCRGFSPAYDLVAFSDGGEQDAVRAWLPADAWIGLTDSPSRVPGASDERYRWVDGTAPSYTSWMPGEPATSRTDGCVILTTEGLWDAASCDFDVDRVVVCELSVVGTDSTP